MADTIILDEAKRKRERDLLPETVAEEVKESQQSGGESDEDEIPNKKPKQGQESVSNSKPKTKTSVSRLRKDLSEMKTQDPSANSADLTPSTSNQESDPSTPSSSGDPDDTIDSETTSNLDNKRKERDMTPTTEAEVLKSSSPSKRRSWKREGNEPLFNEGDEDEEGMNGIDAVEQDVTMVEAKLPTSTTNPFLKPISSNTSYDPAWDEPIEDEEPPKPSIKTQPSPSKTTKPIPTFGTTSSFGSQGSFLGTSSQTSFMSSDGSGFGGFGRSLGGKFNIVDSQQSTESNDTDKTSVVSSTPTASPFASVKPTSPTATSPFGAHASSVSPFGALASTSSPFSTLTSSTNSSFLDNSDASSGFGKLLQTGGKKENQIKEKKVAIENEKDDDEGGEENDEGEEEVDGGDEDSKDAVGVFGSLRELPPSIEVSTGEEGEINLLQVKGKLYVMDMPANQWKERGTGNLRLNIAQDHSQVRLVMRADAVLRVILNTYLKPDILKLSQEDKFVRFAAMENGRATMFAFKVGQKDGARQLTREIESALEEAEDAKALNRLRENPTNRDKDVNTKEKLEKEEAGKV